MATVSVIAKNYGFKKPPLLSEGEFKSFKQIFQMEPAYNMAPQIGFWNEFAFEKWCLIAFFCGLLVSLIWNALIFIPGISFVILFSAMLSGSAESMWNYRSFLHAKNRYYEGLKQAIISSIGYDDFRNQATRLFLYNQIVIQATPQIKL